MSGLYPGASGALADHARLVEEEEWAVLAALALRAGEPEALGALASAADDWKAFAWMWSVFNQGDPRHLSQLHERLAAGAAVPNNRRDAVRDFVLEPDPLQGANPGAYTAYHNQPNNVAAARRAAQEGMLAGLNPATDLARGLARAILGAEEGRYWPGLRHAAFDSLGASRKKVDRLEVLERSSALPPRERLRPLAGLAAPLQKGEVGELLRHLGEALPISGPYPVGGFTEEDHWASARTLAGRLPTPALAKVLNRPWARHEHDRERLFGGGFVARLGPERIRALLGSTLDGAVRRHLIRSASAQLPIGELGDLGLWTHENLDPEWSAPLRNRLSADAQVPHYGSRSEHQERALGALQDFALAGDDPEAAADYAACLAPGEAPALAREALASVSAPRRVGRIAAELLGRAGAPGGRFPAAPDGFRVDVAEMLDLYPADGDRALFLSGMLVPHADPEEKDADGAADLSFLGAGILGYPQATRVFSEAGHGYDLVPAAYDAGDPQEAFLGMAEAAIEHLGEDTLSAVMLKCGWSKMDEGRYGRIVAALGRRPEALLEEAASALDSLSEPDAAAAPAGHLGAILGAALDAAAGELAGPASAPGDHLRDLLNQRDAGLRRLALRWAMALEPEEDILGLLIAKRESTHGLDEEFAEVLRAYARHLAERARDNTLGSDERALALKLARMADPEVAREAAFVVADSARARDLRLAAASVLADTDAHPDDEERLGRLLGEEGDSHTRRWLAAALRNISSGTVTRALENLRSLVGLPPDPEADPRALLPDEVWDARFVECVDGARRNRGGDPKSYVGAIVTLAELLADMAVAERHYADPDNSPLGRRGPEQAAAMRANRSPKPDHGELIRRQPLTTEFPWFRQVAILRENRTAHPALIGSTEPVRVSDEDSAYAGRLFGDIVRGWEAAMLKTRRQGT